MGRNRVSALIGCMLRQSAYGNGGIASTTARRPLLKLKTVTGWTCGDCRRMDDCGDDEWFVELGRIEAVVLELHRQCLGTLSFELRQLICDPLPTKPTPLHAPTHPLPTPLQAPTHPLTTPLQARGHPLTTPLQAPNPLFAKACPKQPPNIDILLPPQAARQHVARGQPDACRVVAAATAMCLRPTTDWRPTMGGRRLSTIATMPTPKTIARRPSAAATTGGEQNTASSERQSPLANRLQPFNVGVGWVTVAPPS